MVLVHIGNAFSFATSIIPASQIFWFDIREILMAVSPATADPQPCGLWFFG